MKINEKYVIIYKTNESQYGWESIELAKTHNECEEFCKKEKFAKYSIIPSDVNDFAFQLQLLTDFVYFEGVFYSPDEKIPFPSVNTDYIEKFDISLSWNDDYNNKDEMDYLEIYNKQGIDWGWGYLWTSIDTNIILPDKTVELLVVAQNVTAYIKEFLENLDKNKFAVYINTEYSAFKWLAWIKDDKVRLIHQEYEHEEVKNIFDVYVDKKWFFVFSKNLFKTMDEFAQKDLADYNAYIKTNLVNL